MPYIKPPLLERDILVREQGGNPMGCWDMESHLCFEGIQKNTFKSSFSLTEKIQGWDIVGCDFRSFGRDFCG